MITFESILDPRERNPDRQKEKRLKCDCRWVNWCCREVSKREERREREGEKKRVKRGNERSREADWEEEERDCCFLRDRKQERRKGG